MKASLTQETIYNNSPDHLTTFDNSGYWRHAQPGRYAGWSPGGYEQTGSQDPAEGGVCCLREAYCGPGNSGFWLVIILTSDWLIQITWPLYWLLIGWYCRWSPPWAAPGTPAASPVASVTWSWALSTFLREMANLFVSSATTPSSVPGMILASDWPGWYISSRVKAHMGFMWTE